MRWSVCKPYCVSCACYTFSPVLFLTSVLFAAAARANPGCGECIALHEGGGSGQCDCALKEAGCDTRVGAEYDSVYRLSDDDAGAGVFARVSVCVCVCVCARARVLLTKHERSKPSFASVSTSNRLVLPLALQ
jgi:hypothetical protein